MQQHPDLSAADGALRDAAEHVRRARADVTTLSSTLSGDIQGIGASWGGEGARAFHRVHVAWQEKQGRIVRALDDFAESLVSTDRDNLATDAARAEVSTRLLSRLG